MSHVIALSFAFGLSIGLCYGFGIVTLALVGAAVTLQTIYGYEA